MARIAFKHAVNMLAGGAVVAACGWSAAASAEELHWTHFGVRPLAMGNAFVAVADDYNSLFYNPAGLARLKEWDGEFINPSAEVSANTLNGGRDTVSLLNSSSSKSSSDQIQSILDLLEKNTGKTQHFALGLTPHLVFPGLGFGVGFDLNTTLAVHREIATDINFGPQIIAPFDMAFNLLEDRLSIGGGLKVVAQGGVDREFSINDIQALTKTAAANSDGADAATQSKASKLQDYVNGGIGVGADFGLLFTPIKTMAPTLGLSILDFGGTPYKKMNISGTALGAPAPRLPSVNMGLSLRPWESGPMYLLTAIDADAVNQPVHYSKKVNLGAEWGYGSIIKVETGLHQGELSAGFEFDVFLLSIRFVTYAEQLGTVAGQDDNLRDRRYALQLKLLI